MIEKNYSETVKTINKGFDLAEKTGNFIAPLIKGTLEQGIGIFNDKLCYVRWKRLNRFIEQANRKMEQLGIDEIQNPIPLKFFIPLLQGATLEENDELQDIWVRLLLKSISDERVELKRVYIDILERLSPLEAKILNVIYSLPFEPNRHNRLLTYKLPNDVEIVNQELKEYENKSLDNDEIELALANLSRTGCIATDRTAGGGDYFSTVNMTLLGAKFYEMCTLPK